MQRNRSKAASIEGLFNSKCRLLAPDMTDGLAISVGGDEAALPNGRPDFRLCPQRTFGRRLPVSG